MHDERLAFRRTVAAIGGWALALLAVRYRTASTEISGSCFEVVG
jgi:hypothetical protein